MSQPSEGLEAADQAADERTFGVDQAAPRTRNQTISVTIPTMEDDEIDDDEDVVKDDLAVPPTARQEPVQKKDAGASSETSEHTISPTVPSEAAGASSAGAASAKRSAASGDTAASSSIAAGAKGKAKKSDSAARRPDAGPKADASASRSSSTKSDAVKRESSKSEPAKSDPATSDTAKSDATIRATKGTSLSKSSAGAASKETATVDAAASAASLRFTSPRSLRVQPPTTSDEPKRSSTSANDGRAESAGDAHASTPPVRRDDRRETRADAAEAPAGAHRPVAYEGDASREVVPQSVSARRAPNAGAESDQMLTAERLLDDRASRTGAPESGIRRILYEASGHLINLGDSKKVRAEKDLTLRIAKPFSGSARFVPVLTRKGGVGKTTVSVLLGMALADARDDRVIAVDANPDRGSLHDRVSGSTDYTVRDAIRRRDDISGYTEFSTLIARDETRLDVLASANELTADAPFDDTDYTTVAALASQYYSMVLTDSGTGMVHEVMRATLEHADSVVLVSGTSVDEARMTSETVSWLEANGYEELARNAVVVVSNRSASTPLIKLDELEAHFSSRVRAVVRLPYDPALASGAPISFTRLKPATRRAARELAASVVEGLPTQRPSYQ